MLRNFVATCVVFFAALPRLFLAHSLPPPEHVASPAQVARAVDAVEAYISSIAGDNAARPGALPLYQYHPAGTKVHGTVVWWHGGYGMPENAAMLGRYLFENGFNVFLPPLAGHAYASSRWPYVLLRDEMGGSAAREALLADPTIGEIVEGIQNGTLKIPAPVPSGFEMDVIVDKALKILEEKLSPKQNKNVLDAFNLLTREDYYPGLEKDFALYFESDYDRYDSTAYHQLSLVVALPGPLYVGGPSAGAPQAMLACARSKRVERAVLLAPFFEPAAPADEPQYRYLLEAVGVLDLYDAPVPGDTSIPSRTLPAFDMAGRMAMQDEVTRNIRENTASFCVFAEDDGRANYEIGIDVCRNALKNNASIAYAFPAEDEVDHFVAPGPLNKFSTAVAKEVLRFFVTGSAHTEEMRSVEGDPDMPPVPDVDAPFMASGEDGMSASNEPTEAGVNSEAMGSPEGMEPSDGDSMHSHGTTSPEDTEEDGIHEKEVGMESDEMHSMRSMG